MITDHSAELVDRAVATLKADGSDAMGCPCDNISTADVTKLKDFTKQQGAFKGMVHSGGVSGTVGDPKKVVTINLVATAIIVDTFQELACPGSLFVLFASMMGHSVPPGAGYDAELHDPRKEGAYAIIESFLGGSADTMYNFSKRGVMLIC